MHNWFLTVNLSLCMYHIFNGVIHATISSKIIDCDGDTWTWNLKVITIIRKEKLHLFVKSMYKSRDFRQNTSYISVHDKKKIGALLWKLGIYVLILTLGIPTDPWTHFNNFSDSLSIIGDWKPLQSSFLKSLKNMANI